MVCPVKKLGRSCLLLTVNGNYRDNFLRSAAEEGFFEFGNVGFVKSSSHNFDTKLFALLEYENSGDTRKNVVFWGVELSADDSKEVRGYSLQKISGSLFGENDFIDAVLFGMLCANNSRHVVQGLGNWHEARMFPCEHFEVVGGRFGGLMCKTKICGRVPEGTEERFEV